MTNDFKKKILDWLSGNYQVSSGNNEPQFSNTKVRTNNFQTKIQTEFPYDYYIDGTLQGYDINNNGLGYTILYGTYYTTSAHTTQKGFIMILDEDFDVVQTIRQYSSGTDFGEFQIMGVGDDGNFFAIEKTNSSMRFVMMNNIIAKLPNDQNYKVVLRRAYALQGESANINENAFKILIKAPGQSKYIIAGNKTNSYDRILTELSINVGASNEWTDYIFTSEDYDDFEIGDIYASWSSSGELTFKLAGIYTDLYNGRNSYGELSGSSNNVGTMTLNTYNFPFIIDQNLYKFDVKKINLNESYFGIIYDSYDYYGTLKDETEIWHFNNGNITWVYNYMSPLNSQNEIILKKINNEVFFLMEYMNDNETQWEIEIGKIIGDDEYMKLVYTHNDVDPVENLLFSVQKQFNLYNYFIQVGNNVYSVEQIYNASGYNGTDYQALNSMIPDHATLSSNGSVIFARTLYNRLVNENTTTSILNVPNNFINDITIDNQSLYGETNSLLVNNNSNIQTNIYEELMINFVNTLLMSNENDSNNKLENNAGATRVNKSISSLKDYDNCKITKYKINYQNDTYVIKTLVSQNITFSNDKTEYFLIIYNDESNPVKNIQLISNDENTTYLTIDCENLETNKCYTFNQDLKVI